MITLSSAKLFSNFFSFHAKKLCFDYPVVKITTEDLEFEVELHDQQFVSLFVKLGKNQEVEVNQEFYYFQNPDSCFGYMNFLNNKTIIPNNIIKCIDSCWNKFTPEFFNRVPDLSGEKQAYWVIAVEEYSRFAFYFSAYLLDDALLNIDGHYLELKNWVITPEFIDKIVTFLTFYDLKKEKGINKNIITEFHAHFSDNVFTDGS